MKTIIVLAMCFQMGSALASVAEDLDSDGDGLSDYQEIHKYLTDPQKKDSDSDGIPDGGWDERQEYTYTIRSVVKVIRLVNIETINDDYQDARVLSENENYIELEVVHYPFNTNAESIGANTDWRKPAACMKEYLEPGITTNWDPKMREDLLKKLRNDRIELEHLTDKAVVEKVSRGLLSQARYRYMFGTYFVHFPNGKPAIFPGLEDAFKREKGNTKLPLNEHFQHELFGRGMFYNKSYGTCTSVATYLTTGLRAAGIPTRMVLAIPVVDPSDAKQLQMLEERLTNHEVRHTLGKALLSFSQGFTAHTFNEVYVGGRWRRLDYSKLGQNIYGDGAMGLLTRVNTFKDLSEANLAATWGLRYGKGSRDSIFRHSNPYRTTEISDHFGPYCNMPNPAVEELKKVIITKAYWFFSDERPEWIKEESVRKDEDGHILVHVDVSFEDLRPIYPRLDKDFVLSAKGHPTICAKAERGYWNSECYIRIPETEITKMAKGVPYTLAPANPNKEYQWIVEKDVWITRR
jgi:hypothetical protein